MYGEGATLADLVDIPDAHQYNPKQACHKKQYERLAITQQRSDGAFLVDLNQNPAADRASCGPFIPRLVTHGCVRSMQKGRNLTKRELMCPAGVPLEGGWYADVIDSWTRCEVPFHAALAHRYMWFASGARMLPGCVKSIWGLCIAYSFKRCAYQ